MSRPIAAVSPTHWSAAGYRLTEAEIGWGAGFFDGEGCIGIHSNTRSVRLTVMVAQVDRRPLDEMARLFGGKVYGPYSNGPGRAAYCQWARHGKGAAEFLKIVAPHLRSKAEQAALGLEYQQFYRLGARPGIVNPLRKAAQAEFVRRLKAMRYLAGRPLTGGKV